MLCPQITAIAGKGQAAERGATEEKRLQVKRGKRWVETRGNQGGGGVTEAKLLLLLQ